MDTSETYIQMCEKASEIQDNLVMFDPDKDGIDNLEACSGHHEVIIDTDIFFQHFIVNKESPIFLPRQDQLQGMYSQKVYDLIYTFGSEFIEDGYSTPDWAKDGNFEIKYTSMEQIWLAFVMHDKYSKIWDGTDWVKEVKDGE